MGTSQKIRQGSRFFSRTTGTAKVVSNFTTALFYIAMSALLMVVLFTNSSLWSDIYFQQSNTPIFYALIVMGGALALLINWRQLASFHKNNYLIWCAAFFAVFLLNVARLLYSEFNVSESTEGIDQLERAALMISIALLILFIPNKAISFFFLPIALFAPCLIIFEFFNPDIFFVEADKNAALKARVAGFWGNQNAAAEVVVLTLALAYKRGKPWMLAVVFTIGLIAVAFTGSRAGMAAISVTGIIFILKNHLPRLYLVVPVIIVISFSAIIDNIGDLATETGRNRGADDLVNRLEFFSADAETDYSTESRAEVAVEGFKAIFEKPILGHGIQYVDIEHAVGPHNLLIDLSYQFGVFGFALWAWLAFLLIKNAEEPFWYNLPFLYFLWFSMFNHNLLEYPWWYIFIALSMFSTQAVNPVKARASSRRRSKARNHSQSKTRYRF